MATPTRRSRRATATKKRYTNDAFEGLQLEGTEILPSSDSSLAEEVNNSAGDEDFAAVALDAAGEGTEADVDEGDQSESLHEEEESAGEMEAADGDVLKANSDLRETSSRTIKRRKVSTNSEVSAKVRGLEYSTKGAGREERTMGTIGSDEGDLLQFVQSRDKWSADVTLPRRTVDRRGIGGFAYPFRRAGESREKDSEASWGWYYEDNGRENMWERQKMKCLGLKEATKFFARRKNSHRVLAGPYGRQTEHILDLQQPLHLETLCSSDQDEGVTNGDKASHKNGWVLYMGAPIRCLSWAPNQDGLVQYLAIAIEQKAPPNIPEHDAFHPSKPWESCIEIWEFPVLIDDDGNGHIFRNQAPRLVHVICAKWGLVRQFKWCPVARTTRDPDELNSPEKSIGLLAGVWSDGFVRTFDVRIPKAYDESTIHVEYQGAAFESKPQHNIYTCLAWKSDRDIIVGLDNGDVCIYDISTTILAPPSSTPFLKTSRLFPFGEKVIVQENLPEPSFRCNFLHDSYVLQMTTCYPQLPHILATTSIDGFTTLTDLRDPARNTAYSGRCRLSSNVIDWYAPGLLIAFTDDDRAQGAYLRRIFTQTTIGKSPGLALTLSCGKAHGCILVGGADGSVTATNPMRKTYSTNRVDRVQLLQTWFKHEWVPIEPPPQQLQQDSVHTSVPSPGPSIDHSTIDPSLQPLSPSTPSLPRDGISRFTSSYKLESLDAKRGLPSKVAAKAAEQVNRGNTINRNLVWTTIYEEESAVTQLEWNPNPSCGGWAAAGMGSGLVRVEDLAL